MRHATHTLRSAFQATASLFLLFALIGASTTATAQSISLPLTFEESIDYGLRDFEPGGVDGPTSTIVADPTDATNMVVQTVRPATAVCYAGTTVAQEIGFNEAIPFTADATTMSVRVWSPAAGALVLFKVEEEGNGALFVETYSYTTVAGGWETMVFDFADPKPNGQAIQVGGNYNKATIFFDFQCDSVPATTLPAADRTYYWDDVAFGGEAGGGGGGGSAISLPLTFEESINYELRDFEPGGVDGPTSTIVADPTDATNMVVQTVRPATAVCYAGTTVAEGVGFDQAIPFTADATTMSVRVWSPEAGALVLLKVEEQGNGALFVETYSYTTVAGGWETMVFDFADPKPNGQAIQVGGNYNKATIFFDFQCDSVPATTLPAADRTYYWDDVAFGGEAGGGGGATSEALIVTGLIDGPLSGGTPKAIELYVAEDIADLSTFALGSANNGGGTDGPEISLSGSASAGDFLYVTDENTNFNAFFGFDATFDASTTTNSFAVSINGDDAVELFYDPAGFPADLSTYTGTPTVVDLFGEIDVDGTGQAWEHLDGWAYRMNATGPDGSTFALDNWSFSGVNALDGETTNATATTPFPIGTYSTMTGGGGGSAISLPITFEESIDYALRDFEPGGVDGPTSTIVADPTDATNMVVQTVRPATAVCYAGTTVAEGVGFDQAIPFTADATTMSVRVWSPEAGALVLFKVEEQGNPALFVETYTYTTVASGWETMVFDFGDPKPNDQAIQVGGNYNKATIFFDFQCDSVPATTLPAADRTYYWDDVAFGGEAGGGDPEEFAGYLLGANEVPAVETGAAGFVEATLDGNELTVTGSFAGLESDYLFSHLHQAPAGGNGPVVVALSPTMNADNRSGVFDETVTLEEAAVNALRAGEIYVNVHSEDNSGGELRAQLVMNPAVAEVTLEQARNIGPGVSVSVSGTVTRALGAFTYFQDATGGLVIRQTSGGFFDDVASGAITGGSTIEVTGELSEFRALLQINGGDLASYAITGTADVPEAQQVTLAELTANGEAYESELVLVRGLTFTDAGGTFGAGTNYEITDATGTGALRVIGADDTAVDGLAIPPANSNVTGVVGQFDRDAPFTDGYQLQPILATDVQVATANEDELARLGAQLAVQNPARGAVSVRFDVGTPGRVTLAVFDALGRQVAVLAEGEMAAGEQTATLGGAALASGVYIVQMRLESGVLTRVVTVVR